MRGGPAGSGAGAGHRTDAAMCHDTQPAMLVHLVDGTYELFRHFYAVPPEKNPDGLEVAAIQGVLASMLYLLGDGATHLAVATDHVIDRKSTRLNSSH